MTPSLNECKLRVCLFEPRIPQNTGNIARTCAAFSLPLDLIEPLGFSLEDRYLKRAGLDYWPYVDINTFPSLNAYLNNVKSLKRLIGFSKSGGTILHQASFKSGDVLLFGREDLGLPTTVKTRCDQIVTIPMPGAANEAGDNGVRSLNLSAACALATYQAGLKIGIL